MALKNVNVTVQTYSSDGREFHSLGAATWNALSLRVTFVLKEGASSKTAQEERKLYTPCDFAWTRSWTSSVWVFNAEPYTDPPFGGPVFAEPRGITSPCERGCTQISHMPRRKLLRCRRAQKQVFFQQWALCVSLMRWLGWTFPMLFYYVVVVVKWSKKTDATEAIESVFLYVTIIKCKLQKERVTDLARSYVWNKLRRNNFKVVPDKILRKGVEKIWCLCQWASLA